MLPALQLAQERNGGWLSEETLREAADALELTPGVLPFDRVLLRHVPHRARRAARRRGLHERLVRALGRAGRRRGVRALARDLDRRDDRGRERHAAGGRVPGRMWLGNRCRGEQQASPANERRRRPGTPRGARRSELRPRDRLRRHRGRRAHRARRVREGRRPHRAPARARDDARRDHRRAQRVEPAWSWRRLLPDRSQVELRPEAGAGAQAALPRRQRRRVRARHLQGPRDHAPRPAPVPRGLPDRGPRDRSEARLRLHPRRVRARVRDPRRRAPAAAQGQASRRGDHRPAPRRRRIHLWRGDGAPRVARGKARPAADEASVPRRSPGSTRRRRP